MRYHWAIAAWIACGCDREPRPLPGNVSPSVVAASASAVVSTAPSSVAPPPASSTATTDDGPETVEDSPDEPEPSTVADAACAPPDPQLKPILLLRFGFTSGVEGKDSRDKLSVARPGQRVYSHFTVRNRTGRDRCVRIELRVNGKRRTTLTLKIGESWAWRTWGYNTLRHDDGGTLVAIVRDDQGKELAKRELSIVAEPKK
jgi:hypothetical protein